MKNLKIVLTIAFIFSITHKNYSQNLNTSQKWAFKHSVSPLSQELLADDTEWDSISTNESWEVQGYEGLDGYGYYQKTFFIDASLQKAIEQYGGLRLKIDNIDDADALYVNHKHVLSMGSFPPNYSGRYGVKRDYLIPAEFLKIPGNNVVTIIVYDAGGDGGIISRKVELRPYSIIDYLKPSVSTGVKNNIYEKNEKVEFEMNLKNISDSEISCNLYLKVLTDENKPVSLTKKKIKISGDESITESIIFKLKSPGFYKCSVYAEKDEIIGNDTSFVIGYQPEQILSPLDGEKDFFHFWQITMDELKAVKPRYELTKLPEYSTGKRDIYHVSMYSWGDVKIEGYYAVPKVEGKYPAIVQYMGYGSDPYLPNTDHNPDFVEFILSVRGQGIQKATNTYGDWILWGLTSKEEYYYRGAFMDLIRAIDFVASRPEVDADKIVAEGGSQGGAFTFVASALDSRIKACAPTIPFLSDYEDYFKVARWPANVFINYHNEHPEISWKHTYELLSYFDIKNFAPYIKCPLIMSVGLKDEVCPPHINFAAYNQVSSPKKYYAYPEQGHSVPNEWYGIRMAFFKEQLGLK